MASVPGTGYEAISQRSLYILFEIEVSVDVQLGSLNCVQFFAISWTAACQSLLSITNSQTLLKVMSIELVMPSNHLILCHPLFLLPSIFPSLKVFCIFSGTV